LPESGEDGVSTWTTTELGFKDNGSKVVGDVVHMLVVTVCVASVVTGDG
jgi:hypothetical protein